MNTKIKAPLFWSALIFTQRLKLLNLSLRYRRSLLVGFLCVIIMLPATPGSYAGETEYDVIVAGAGAGGITAAIQAARMGVNVLVTEESSWIGGQMTAAGVTTMDDLSNQKSGIYREFINAVEEHYKDLNKSPNLGYFGNRTISFEPKVGQNILYELVKGVRSAGGKLDIMLGARISEVEVKGNVVTGIKTGGNNIKCKVLIDATEYGDVIPLAGAPYRAGNSVSPDINSEAMIQDINWTAVIKHYPNGVPEQLKAKSYLSNYMEEHKRNYSRYLTTTGGDNPWRIPQNLTTHNAYRAMPDSSLPGFYDGSKANWKKITKSGVNFGNDYPGRIGWDKGRSGLPVRYLDEIDLRRTVNRRALIKTLNFIYYIQHELGGAGKNWSVADDEYYSNEALDIVRDFVPPEWHEIVRRMPVIPYVRESRRILGEVTLTSQMLLKNSLSYRDGRTNLEFRDAIAVGRYNLDLHNSGEAGDFELSLNESAASIENNRPRANFQVPLSIFVPVGIDGFIAAEKNLSMSRLAAGALRLQPICMMTGQAAGALAAIASRENIQPRNVPAIKVQWELLKAGVNLSLAKYRDVPHGHKYNAATQIASIHTLLEPLSYPHNPSYNKSDSDNRRLGVTLIKGPPLGTFGIDRLITEKDRKQLLSKAPGGFVLPEKITRGEALDMLVKAILKIY
ncbi:MAG: FAD-dependent oxidoreductase [Synergistaceae bacterium]|nr:FAD-dependent oxidoreductase [Synergistaceae bacterium]